MFEYLVGTLICGVVWLLLFLKRKDLRGPMVWTGAVYMIFSSLTLLIWSLLSIFTYVGDKIIPSYWNPPMMFRLGEITGFGGIEDALFIFFVAGIATCIYEVLFHKKIKIKKSYKPHLRALVVCLVSFFILAHYLPYNLIYSLILSYVIGAVAILLERKDLFKHALFGGISFLVVYTALFIIFNLVFPSFISQFYTVSNLWGISVFGIPIEEYLFAFSFGLMWAPIYEYEHGEKNI